MTVELNNKKSNELHDEEKGLVKGAEEAENLLADDKLEQVSAGAITRPSEPIPKML